jgi:hypothetical protein
LNRGSNTEIQKERRDDEWVLGRKREKESRRKRESGRNRKPRKKERKKEKREDSNEKLGALKRKEKCALVEERRDFEKKNKKRTRER